MSHLVHFDLITEKMLDTCCTVECWNTIARGCVYKAVTRCFTPVGGVNGSMQTDPEGAKHLFITHF